MTVKSITSRNVNDALEEALWWIATAGISADSRNGRVIRAPGPVITTYTNPAERVLFSAKRDANPFFHHMEAIWMLGGRNDVAFPATYAKQLSAYSDDDVVLAGAYGYRWRKHFGADQLALVIHMLSTEPTTRRAVLSMWDGASDLPLAIAGGLDVPCNTQAYFECTDGALNMTVCCRSNDAVWGAYGANAVHFSMLHQFIAEAAGLRQGWYAQFSNNLHVYADRPDVARLLVPRGGVLDIEYHSDDLYESHVDGLPVKRFIADGETWFDFLRDADLFLDDPTGDTQFTTEYFSTVVAPMQNAHTAFKNGDYAGALAAADSIAARDWALACMLWLSRRIDKKGGAA